MRIVVIILALSFLQAFSEEVSYPLPSDLTEAAKKSVIYLINKSKTDPSVQNLLSNAKQICSSSEESLLKEVIEMTAGNLRLDGEPLKRCQKTENASECLTRLSKDDPSFYNVYSRNLVHVNNYCFYLHVVGKTPATGIENLAGQLAKYSKEIDDKVAKMKEMFVNQSSRLSMTSSHDLNVTAANTSLVKLAEDWVAIKNKTLAKAAILEELAKNNLILDVCLKLIKFVFGDIFSWIDYHAVLLSFILIATLFKRLQHLRDLLLAQHLMFYILEVICLHIFKGSDKDMEYMTLLRNLFSSYIVLRLAIAFINYKDNDELLRREVLRANYRQLDYR